MFYDILHNTPIITEYMYKAFDMALFAVCMLFAAHFSSTAVTN